MAAVNEWIAREYFEMLGYLVCQPRKYTVPGRQKKASEEVDLVVLNTSVLEQKLPEALVPLAIDEFPVLFVAAACANGVTRLSGAEELRVKESDRIQVMADGLAKLGVDVEAKSDGIAIQGGQIGGGEVDSHGDHRIAMAFSVASLRAAAEIRITDCANVGTSFPGFVELSREAGIRIEINEG